MSRSIRAGIGWVLMSLPWTAVAQPPAETDQPRPEQARNGQTPRNQLSAERLPKVGATLPEVALHDDQGQPFSTANLRGQYTVLVFGCLT